MKFKRLCDVVLLNSLNLKLHYHLCKRYHIFFRRNSGNLLKKENPILSFISHVHNCILVYYEIYDILTYLVTFRLRNKNVFKNPDTIYDLIIFFQ